MEQHPIPRQITTFEFKLIGFMTLRQFLYLVIFIPLGFVVFKIFPIPLINILLGLIVAFLGVALAFFPINERPLEVWIRNLIKRINSPTQYFFLKNNPPISIFQNLYFFSDPHRVLAHVDSQQKLASYLITTKQTVGRVSRNSYPQVQNMVVTKAISPTPISTSSEPVILQAKQPFITGIIKNNKKIPLPGILIYLKDKTGIPVRLLKTNPYGIFATYSALVPEEYIFEIKDPKGTYFFDTIKIRVENINLKPIEINSKELL